MKDLFFVLDQGTTEHKLIVFGVDGRVVDVAIALAPKAEWHKDGLSFDPQILTATSNQLIHNALKKYPNRFLGFGFANQGETVMAWDRQNGKSLSRMVSWQCHAAEAEFITTKASAADLIQSTTGLKLSAYFSAAKMQRLLAVNPAVQLAAENRELAFGTLDSWMISQWTRSRAHITDPTTACRTLVFDIQQMAWSRELCALFGIDLVTLPTVIPNDDLQILCDAGPFAHEPMLLLASLCDQPASLIGHGGLLGPCLKISMGTGAFVDLVLPAQTADLFRTADLLTSVLFKSQKHSFYYLEGGVLNFGNALTESKNVKATIQDLVRQIAEIVTRMATVATLPATVFVDGGFSQNAELICALAEVLQKPVVTQGSPQITAVGVARVVIEKIGGKFTASV